MSPGIGIPSDVLGFGAVAAVIALLIYLVVLGLMLWIFYLIIRAAVTSGIMRASARGAFREMAPPHYPGPPRGPGPGQPGGPPYGG